MLTGRVIKTIGGFAFVETAENTILRCTVRKKVKEAGRILPGDVVKYERLGPQEGVIEDIEPRTSCLERPSIANVSRVVAVITLKHPSLNLRLLDKILVVAENKGISPIICLNKSDLNEPGDARDLIDTYRRIGYPVVVTSAKTGAGIDELVQLLRGQISVFSGQSGVGKSSLLNAINPRLKLRVGDLGKWDEGRHTTRSVELFRLEGGGYVADTPGFQRLNCDSISSSELGLLFPEIARKMVGCEFRSCLHRGEKGCAVLRALEAGEVSPTRYENYLDMLDEIMEAEEAGKWVKR